MKFCIVTTVLSLILADTGVQNNLTRTPIDNIRKRDRHMLCSSSCPRLSRECALAENLFVSFISDMRFASNARVYYVCIS
jgi:hypothetical protein